MSFFIRNKSKGFKPNVNNKKRKGGKIDNNQFKKKKGTRPYLKDTVVKNDEEIPSDDEEDFIDSGGESEEDVPISVQEKKLQLAKKYLDEIAKEEQEKLDGSEIDNQVIVNRLRDEVLEQSGKLRKKIGDKIRTEVCEKDLQVLKCKEHKLSITCLAISSDGCYLYSGSKDCSIVKWCLKEGKKIRSIPSKHKNKDNPNLHSSVIYTLAVSNDNKYLASGGEEMVVRLWNPETMEHIHTFTGHRAAITGVSFCRFTQTLFSCSKDRTVKLWNLAEKGYVETLFGHQAPITGIDSLCRDRAVTSGGTDNTLRVWKIPEESQLIFNGHSRSIDSVKRLNDQYFLSCGGDGELNIWSMFKKKPVHSIKSAHGNDPLTGEPNWVMGLAALSNTEVFATGSCDGFIRVWACEGNMRSASQISAIPVKGFVNALAFSADEKLLVAGIGQEHRLGRWSRIKEAKNSIIVVNIKNEEVSKEADDSS